MVHRFQCRCGTLQGEIAQPALGVRAACYCGDCQTYAHLLGEAPRVLDAQGGTEVVATTADRVRFTAGMQSLACLSLSPRGLLRWYARCCNTPIANTPRNWKLPYAGVVHTCLRQPAPLESSFPRVLLRVNKHGAHGEPSRDASLAGVARFAALMVRLAGARLSGGYRASPFFTGEGRPVAGVEVAGRDAVQAARAASSRR